MNVVAGIKKSVWNFGAICFFAWFGFKTLVYTMDLFGIEGLSPCGYTDVAKFTSPNGKKIAGSMRFPVVATRCRGVVVLGTELWKADGVSLLVDC